MKSLSVGDLVNIDGLNVATIVQVCENHYAIFTHLHKSKILMEANYLESINRSLVRKKKLISILDNEEG